MLIHAAVGMCRVMSCCLVVLVGSAILLSTNASATAITSSTTRVLDQVSGAESINPCPAGDYVMGRDTPWVPTPDELVERMLDLVELTSDDYVIDLGSGDGRMLIAAARRGASGHGVEFNPTMVACANLLAKQAGVTDQIQFVQGDMFEADISQATVLPLFLLEENLAQLTPTFLKLKPGTRIATNDFEIPGWRHEREVRRDSNCVHWCRALLWIVPAQVQGTWSLDQQGEIVLDQFYQDLRGTYRHEGKYETVTGRLKGNEITLTIGGLDYRGAVMQDSI